MSNPSELAITVARIDTKQRDQENRINSLEKKLDSIRNWIMGTLATALIGIVIELVKKNG